MKKAIPQKTSRIRFIIEAPIGLLIKQTHGGIKLHYHTHTKIKADLLLYANRELLGDGWVLLYSNADKPQPKENELVTEVEPEISFKMFYFRVISIP